MLYPARLQVFALFSILIHVTFAIFFARVTLSFSPPDVKELSLAILIRGEGEGEIFQNEATWPMPLRAEPDFSAEDALSGFDAEIEKWTQFGVPGPPFFSPKETLVPHIEITDLSAEVYIKPSGELFSHLPAESKTRPMTGFALGPAIPEIFESD